MAEQPQSLTLFPVDAASVGQRLDVFLATQAEGTSRSALQKLIAAGAVTVNGVTATAKQSTVLGDQVVVRWQQPPASPLTPVAMPLQILFEDDDLIVLDKPAGICVHPGAGDTGPTLVQGLLHHCGRLGGSVARAGQVPVWNRPGIVHRLDKDTTGVMVCAKTDRAHAALSKQFQDKTTLLREYLALLDGAMPQTQLAHASFLYRDPKRRLRFASMSEPDFRRLQIGHDELQAAQATGLLGRRRIPSLSGYRRAQSLFTREAVFGQRLTLARVRLFTGRTHQIRVHACDVGLPIIGDQLYHRRVQLPLTFSALVRELVAQAPRQMLHAQRLGLVHPVSGQSLVFEAPLPSDFAATLTLLWPYQTNL